MKAFAVVSQLMSVLLSDFSSMRGLSGRHRAADLYEHPANKNITLRVKFNVTSENIKAKIQEKEDTLFV